MYNLINGLINFSLIILGAITFNIVVIAIGLYRFISTVAGGPDDPIGNYSVSFEHSELAIVNAGGSIQFSSNDIEEDEEDPIESGGNDWALEGSIKVL